MGNVCSILFSFHCFTDNYRPPGCYVNQDPCHYNWIDYYRLPARHAISCRKPNQHNLGMYLIAGTAYSSMVEKACKFKSPNKIRWERSWKIHLKDRIYRKVTDRDSQEAFRLQISFSVVFFNIPFPGRSIIFNIRLYSGRFQPDAAIFFRQIIGWRIYFQDLNSIDSVLSFSNSKVQKTFE